MLKLDITAAERFVAGYPNASWNGWVIELFKPTPSGFTSKNGAFREGQWGKLSRIAPNEQGRWVFRV